MSSRVSQSADKKDDSQFKPRRDTPNKFISNVNSKQRSFNYHNCAVSVDVRRWGLAYVEIAMFGYLELGQLLDARFM
jgi:hypothetical protein